VARSRSYEDMCGIARALDVIGERWALLIVRELMLGPKRYTDLEAGLRRISPDVLAARLRELEAAGVLRRDTLPPPAASRVYALTGRGRELEQTLLALGRWGSRAPVPVGGARLGVDAAMLALPTLFSPERAGELDASYELKVGGERFAAVVGEGRLELTRGVLTAPDAVIEVEPGVLAAILWHGRTLAEAVSDGEAEVRGSRRAANRFLRLFPLPDPPSG